MQVKLRVLVGKTTGKEIVVPGSHFLIGRSEDCDLRPKSDAISRKHCAILTHERADQVLIRDLNSRNGTFVNGQRVAGEIELKSGDHVQLGKLEFEVSIRVTSPKPKPEVPVNNADKPARNDGDSLAFDVSEWLEEGAVDRKSGGDFEPETTRQFQLDETDRLTLAQAAEGGEASAANETPKPTRPEKREPGKLPPRPGAEATTSREAAADMLKKFFHNR